MRPLAGVKVLEVGQYIAAPYCAMSLADQGAEVIKVERPGVGDPRRSYDPLVRRGEESVSGGFMSYNRNKKSVTLDMRRPSGQDAFRRLAGSVDVIVENLRPGSMDRLGLGYEQLREVNPRLIYCAISGFGRLESRRGPFSDRPAFDTAVQAVSGMVSLIGEEGGEPLSAPAGFADIYTAVQATAAIGIALYARERTGEGVFIDQAMYDSVVSLMERPLMLYEFTGEVPTRGIDRYAPVGALRTSDGHISTIIPTEEMWRRFCAAIERPDLLEHPELDTVIRRSERFNAIVKPEAERWTSTRTRAEVVERFIEQGLPAGEVQTIDEVHRCPQIEARHMLLDIDDPVSGPTRLPRTPLMFDGFEEPAPTPAPALGEHTHEVLAELAGFDDHAIEALRQDGAI